MGCRNPCEYDQSRKRATEDTLKRGIQRMKANKQYRGKPLSVYALSKETGVARSTIMRFPGILEELNKTKYPEIRLKNAHVKTGAIRRVEDAQAVVETLEKMYNEVTDKYNAVLDSNLKLNLELVKLQDEKAELKHQLDILLKGRV